MSGLPGAARRRRVDSVALLHDGTARSWGWNGFGQLGNGSVADSAVPVPVERLRRTTSVAAGTGHSLVAMSSD